MVNTRKPFREGGKPGGFSGKPGGPRRENDTREQGRSGAGRGKRRPEVSVKGRSDRYWIYGVHSVEAALQNPERQFYRLWVTEGGFEKLQTRPDVMAKAKGWGVEKVAPDMFNRVLREDATHQGIAAEVSALPDAGLEVLTHTTARGPVLLLDQVTDPHNVGAILRSAAAFDCKAVIMTRRHSAQESGVVARSAAGALEKMPIIRVTNLVQAMLGLKASGYWCIGLDAESPTSLHDVKLGDKVALLLGAEGKGLRRLTLEHCDVMAKLPMSDRMESLNVSNAAAIAMYELYKQA